MLKLLSLILIGVLLINSCGYTQSVDIQRKAVIEQTIEAIVKYDTTSLFLLVDTNFYFDIYGKEGFIYKIRYINNQLKTCQTTSVADSLLTKKEIPGNSTEYILSCCKFKNNKINSDRFDLVFSFANYENEARILTIDIKTYKTEMLKPAVPIIKSN